LPPENCHKKGKRHCLAKLWTSTTVASLPVFDSYENMAKENKFITSTGRLKIESVYFSDEG
jgi:hypothetical protein